MVIPAMVGEELKAAIEDLTSAAGTRLEGAARVQAAVLIAQVREAIAPGSGRVTSAARAKTSGVPDLKAAIGRAGLLCAAQLSGHRFYLANHALQSLAFLTAGFSSDGVPGSPAPRAFEALALEAKARVEAVSRGFGLVVQPAAPVTGAAGIGHSDGTPGGTPSGPSAEHAPLASVVPADPASESGTAEAVCGPPDEFRPHAPPFDDGAAPVLRSSPPKTNAPARAAKTSTPAGGRASASPGAGVTAASDSPAAQKSLFSLWLDLFFGPKRPR